MRTLALRRHDLLAVLALALALAGLACHTLAPPQPALEWDPSPEALIIEAYDSGGMVAHAWSLNALPIARVYGDGRILWTVMAAGRREVYAGRLTPEQMRALLAQFSAAGFFGWKDFYDPEALVYDAGTTTLRVNLLSASRAVVAYFNGAPPKYYALVRTLGQGAGAAGVEFVPQVGYLMAFPLPNSQFPAEVHWPDAEAGFTLAEAVNGRYIEGEVLAQAWAIVNSSPLALVESGGQPYELVVQVPGLSQAQPPAP